MKKSLIVRLTESVPNGCLATSHPDRPLPCANDISVRGGGIKQVTRGTANPGVESTVNLVFIVPLPDDGPSLAAIARWRPVRWN